MDMYVYVSYPRIKSVMNLSYPAKAREQRDIQSFSNTKNTNGWKGNNDGDRGVVCPSFFSFFCRRERKGRGKKEKEEIIGIVCPSTRQTFCSMHTFVLCYCCWWWW